MTIHNEDCEFNSTLNAQHCEFGMDADITRRDFLNVAALGAGAALLSAAAPSVVMGTGKTQPDAGAATHAWDPWTGYGGVGDYANSNGNTWDVVSAAHGIRDHLYGEAISNATPTGEEYDLVVVGGGFAGSIAAYTFLKETSRKRRVLLLDNHPIIGGEAKRNEFIVRGQRLIGPQGSNGTAVPGSGSSFDEIGLGAAWCTELWRGVGLPTEFQFGQLPHTRRSMEFPLSNYDSGGGKNQGHFFDTPRPHWVTDPWGRSFQGTPLPEEVRRDFVRLLNEPAPEFQGDQASLEQWLDTMTYDDYLTKHRGLHPEVARYLDPSIAAGVGLGTDAISACLAYRDGEMGFQGLSRLKERQRSAQRTTRRTNSALEWFSFPGGNDGILRAIVKWLNPEVIEGSNAFVDIHNGGIRFDAMDRPEAICRMRTGATVVSVTHDPQDKSRPASVTYLKAGKFFSVKARTVIWAAGSWSSKHVVQQLPEEYREAMEGFPRSPMLVVNVALENWRALYKLGYTCCSWRGGFGFSGNIRAPMYVGDYRPPLDPDQPIIFTLYVPFPQRGLPLVDQGKVARAILYATSYRDFELKIRQQLTKLFGMAGFDARRDIAGIVLNRWGHAYANAGPGFFYGKDGKPAPSAILRRPLGNLAFAHTELAGIAAWWNAGQEGVRAAKQMLALL